MMKIEIIGDFVAALRYRAAHAADVRTRQQHEPCFLENATPIVNLFRSPKSSIWFYQNRLFSIGRTVQGEWQKDEIALFIKDWWFRHERELERRRARIEAREQCKQSSNQNQRKRIPNDVQDRVWQRDGGKCVNCGSKYNLEFDHIIPVSLGGSNRARNIQLSCETCNRSKGATIGG